MSYQPEVFGKYYLVDRIAVGGMAEIFKAKITGPGGFEKIMVVKRILNHLGQNEDFVDMFMDEARISSTLNHSNIIHIFDFGQLDQNYFIAMEYLHGRDLKTLMKKCQRVGRPLPLDFAVYVLHEMCKALDHAHHKKDGQNKELNILHRDISPSNVLISYEEGQVKLADFGIAKAEGATYQTQAGVLKGKFEYMSPEQASGKPIDRRSDLFSTGIVLYELLTRRRLFKAKSDIETLEMIRDPKVPPPSHFNPEIPPELDAIVLKALAGDPADRYSEAWELQRDLREFMRPKSPDIIAGQLARFLQELFQQEIEDERLRLERGSRLIQEALRNGGAAEEIALDDPYSLPDDSSFTHPNTQISFTVTSGNQERRRIGALLVVLAVVVLGTALILWFSNQSGVETVAEGGGRSGSVVTDGGSSGGEASALGSLLVGVEPVEARVFLGTQEIGVASPESLLTFKEVPLGEAVWVKVEAEGYRTLRRPLLLTGDQPRETMQFALEPLEETAPAKVASKPPPPKAPTSTGTKPASGSSSAPVAVVPRVTSPSQPKSAPGATGAQATLNLVSIPAGAVVYIDGQRACRTPCPRDVSVGKAMEVAFQLAGYERFVTSVEPVKGEEIQVRGTLRRAEMGQVSLRFTNQAPVEVYIDGLRQGYGVMFNKLSVTAGSHTITLKNADLGISKSLDVTVKPGDHQELLVDLGN